MARLNSYSLLALALSKFVIASPLLLRSQTTVPSNVASGTITAGCSTFHTVASGETCLTIEQTFGITDPTFKIMNPEIDPTCDNLVSGSAYCVQTSNLTTIPSNVSPGTITSGCIRYSTVSATQSCPDLASQGGVTVQVFHALNPQINPGCTNLITGEAYCVLSINSTIAAAPPNVATGTMTTGCTAFHTIVSGDTCPSIETQFDTTFAALQFLNPEIDNNCDNLLLGEAYCVASSNPVPVPPPSNVAPGTITTGCTEYFTVQSGQTCANIETMFGITLASIQALNPEVNDQCTNIIAGEAYCVQSTSSS